MRRMLVIAAISCALGVSAVAITAAPADASEGEIVGLLNGYRAANGLPALEVSGELAAKARGWSQTMAANGGIAHSNLASGISTSWVRLGENVGRGASASAIHDAWVSSPTHRANLLDPGFRLVGVGVFVDANGGLWATQVFMEPASQPAPSSPAPATGTPSSPDSAPAPAVEPSAAPPPPPPSPSAQLTATLERLRDLEAA